jgi:hypothetical protein
LADELRGVNAVKVLWQKMLDPGYTSMVSQAIQSWVKQGFSLKKNYCSFVQSF